MTPPEPDPPAEDEPASVEGSEVPQPPARPEWLVGTENAWEVVAYRPQEIEPERTPPRLPTFQPLHLKQTHAGPIPTEAPEVLRVTDPPSESSHEESEESWIEGPGEPPPDPAPGAREEVPPARPRPDPGARAPTDPAAILSAFRGPAAEEVQHKTPSMWQETLHRVRTDRQIQLILAAVVLAIVLVLTTMHAASAVPIGRIKRNPHGFDGQSVTVRGRVGEVFDLGGSHVYYLYQGRDSIVVFTRLQPPRPRQKLAVTGSVSTGFLEGVPRAALFEESR